MSEDIKPVFFKSPKAFRKWLEKHHATDAELWVGYYKVSTGKPSMTWVQSVQQALCFGWIDGIRKSIDDTAYMIRFTPRKPNSNWSAVNLKHFEALKTKGLIAPAGQTAYDVRRAKDKERYAYERGQIKLPKEYLAQFKSNKKAWKFFQSLPPSVKKPSIWYVMSAKRKDTQLRRLATLISCSESGLRIPPLRRN